MNFYEIIIWFLNEWRTRLQAKYLVSLKGKGESGKKKKMFHILSLFMPPVV